MYPEYDPDLFQNAITSPVGYALTTTKFHEHAPLRLK